MSTSLEAIAVEAGTRDPKPTLGAYTLPCGYLDADGKLHRDVVLNEISGYEEDMLANKSIDPFKKMNLLLIGCLKSVGPYTDKKKISEIVPNLLVGDRMFLIYAIRRVTLGDEYPYSATCPECDKTASYMVNLEEVKVRPMPTPEKRIYDDVLPNGKTIRYHCMDGVGEGLIFKHKNSPSALSELLAQRIDLIDGKPASVDLLQTLGMGTRQYIRDVLFDKVDGGVETEVEMECSECGAEFAHDLDIGQQGFFFPSAVRKNLKRKSST